MIVIVNLLIELMITGLFTAIFLVIFARLGILPMFFVAMEHKEEDEKDDLPY